MARNTISTLFQLVTNELAVIAVEAVDFFDVLLNSYFWTLAEHLAVFEHF